MGTVLLNVHEMKVFILCVLPVRIICSVLLDMASVKNRSAAVYTRGYMTLS